MKYEILQYDNKILGPAFQIGSVLAGNAHLVFLGDGVHELDVQPVVVLGQRHMAVVVDQLHHWVEAKRLREAIAAVLVDDLDQLVAPSMSAG